MLTYFYDMFSQNISTSVNHFTPKKTINKENQPRSNIPMFDVGIKADTKKSNLSKKNITERLPRPLRNTTNNSVR